MTQPLADDALRERGLDVLERELGPTQALRFLAMVSRQPFDYQKWRQGHFDAMSLDQVLAESRAVSG
jgi:hypothetical protein